jgi:hypothetical protein
LRRAPKTPHIDVRNYIPVATYPPPLQDFTFILHPVTTLGQ